MATVDPQDQQELNKLYQEYIRLLQIADGITASQAKSQADIAKATGNLSTSVSRLNKELNDTLFKSDYLYQSFRETTAELKNQNILLQLGKSTFKTLTNLASDLNYFQQGITDLSGKQLKQQTQKLKISEDELETVKQNLSNSVGEYKNQDLLNRLINIKRNSEEGLTKEQEKRLGQLQKEKELLQAANNTLEEGLPALQQELAISKQIYKIREDTGGLAKAATGVVSKYGGSLARFLNVDEAIESVNEYSKSLIDGALKSKEVIDKIKDIEEERIALLQNSIGLQEEINRLNKEINEANNATSIIAEHNNKIAEINNKLSNQGLLTSQQIQQLHDERAALGREILRVQDLSNNSVDNENKLRKKQNELLQDEVQTKIGLAALDEKEAQVKQAAVASVGGLTNKFKSLGVLIKGLGEGFKKSLTDPLVLLTFFIGKALEANKQTVELGKALGYAGGKADLYRESLAQIARSSTNIFVTTANLSEAFNELAQASGFAYEFTADQLETQIKLTKQVGLTADEAAQVQRFAVLNGKTSEETYQSFIKGLAATRNQLKVGINFKAALAEATKVSGQLAANLGNNPETIAKAVVTAKAFGMTLDQVAKSGESLLNFESSIENELKAELLTGKQLNLERARAAALAGDQVTVAEEIAKNIGSSTEFTRMNVLQQKALAESVGMTADELANTLRKREEAIKSGKSLAQVTAEEAQQALERTNIQDKFNAAILKLQDFIGNLVAGPLGTFIDMLTDALSLVNLIALPFSAIYELTSMIGNGIGGWLDGLGLAGKIIKGIASAAIIYAAYATFAAVSTALAATIIGGIAAPFVGAAAAAAVTAAGFGLLNSRKGDDILSEGGYGKRTLLSPEGAIKLNDKDTVIAGTNLGGGGNIQTPQINLTPMIAAINEVRAAVKELTNRPITINLDGKEVGSGLVQASPKSA